MGFFDKFPYTNFHELNLDWIISKIRHIDASVEESAASAAAAKQSEDNAAASEQQAGDYASAAHTSKVNAASSAGAAAVSAQTAAQDAAAVAEEVGTVNARLDTLIVDGQQTAGNTELLDIRTAYDNLSYPLAGDAVREQVADIHAGIDGFLLESVDQSGWYQNGYYNTNTGHTSPLNGSTYSQQLSLAGVKEIIVRVTGYGDARGICFYDADNQWISGTVQAYAVGTNTYRITPPAGADTVGITGPCDKVLFAKNPQEADAYTADLRWTDNVYWNATNGYMSNLSGAQASKQIPLNGATRVRVYVTGYNDNRGIVYYDKAGAFLSGVKYPAGKKATTYIVPDGAYMIGVTRQATDTDFSLKMYGQEAYIIGKEYASAAAFSPLAMFAKVGFCGDSYTKSQIYTQGGVSRGYFEKSGYPAVMGRRNAFTPSVFAWGGGTTHSFLTEAWGMTAALNAPAQDLYIIAFGINDRTYVTKGSMADIKPDYTQNPDTFYGNMGRIIEQLQDHAPNAKIVLMKSYIPYDANGMISGYYDYSSSPCEQIAEHYGIAYVETLESPLFRSLAWQTDRWGGHPTAQLYAAMAEELNYLIGKAILLNPDYFGDFVLE